MTGSRLAFYKVPVSLASSNGLERASAPHKLRPIEVLKCFVVDPSSPDSKKGMESKAYRQETVKHLEAFKLLARECQSAIMKVMTMEETPNDLRSDRGARLLLSQLGNLSAKAANPSYSDWYWG